MTIKSSLILAFAFLVIQLSGQNKTAVKFSKSIKEEEMRQILTFLASDSLEGRETGARGQKIAARFIADKFESMGLEGPVKTSEGTSYFQEFELQKATFNQVYLQKGKARKENFKDFLYYSKNETYGEEWANVVFAGYGDSATLNNVGIDGKYVAFLNKDYESFRSTLKEMSEAQAKRIHVDH